MPGWHISRIYCSVLNSLYGAGGPCALTVLTVLPSSLSRLWVSTGWCWCTCCSTSTQCRDCSPAVLQSCSALCVISPARPGLLPANLEILICCPPPPSPPPTAHCRILHHMQSQAGRAALTQISTGKTQPTSLLPPLPRPDIRHPVRDSGVHWAPLTAISLLNCKVSLGVTQWLRNQSEER